MNLGIKFGLVFTALIVFLAIATNANEINTTTAWVVPEGNSLSLSPVQIGCINLAGYHDINITARLMPENSLDNSADINAEITKPNNSIQTVSLSGLGSGAYGYSYNFDSNGTYRIDFAAEDSESTAVGTASVFAYVGDFDLNISFLNNNPSYSAGNTGTIRNYVTNIEGNAMTGLTGSTIIYYPNSSVFESSSMNESGSGEYYYNFTVPSTAGNYTAISSFTCGTNTDSNNAGKFRVSSTGSGDTGGSTGGTGGSSGGGSGGGNAAGGDGKASPAGTEQVTFSTSKGIMQNIDFSKTEIHSINEIQILPSESVNNASITVQQIAKTELAEIPEPYKVFKYAKISTSLETRQIEKAGIKFKVEKLWVSINEIEKTSIVLWQYGSNGWSELPTILVGEDDSAYYFQANLEHFSYFAIAGLPAGSSPKGIVVIEGAEFQKPKIGEQSTPVIKVFNNSNTELMLKIQVEIIQGIDAEYISEENTAVKAEQSKEISFAEKWTPIFAGTHIASIKVFSPDKRILYDTKILRIDIEGELRYDVSVQCQQTAMRGSAADMNIFILNAGDYYQDIDVSWEVKDPEAKKITGSSMPLALMPREKRTINEKIAIQQDALPGIYTAKAIVKYWNQEKTGTCSFTVISDDEIILKQEQVLLAIAVLAGLLAIIALFLKARPASGFKAGNHLTGRFAVKRNEMLERILGFNEFKGRKRRGKGKGFSSLLGFKE